MTLIEQAKQLLELPKGTTSIIDLAPILHAFVEMAELLELVADRIECEHKARALLKRLRSES